MMHRILGLLVTGVLSFQIFIIRNLQKQCQPKGWQAGQALGASACLTYLEIARF